MCLKKHSGWPENLKKVQAKKNSWNQINQKIFCEIAFLAVLNFFPVQKLIFGHFWNCKKKIEFGQKKILWNWFIWFHEFFFASTFLNFLACCETCLIHTHMDENVFSKNRFFLVQHVFLPSKWNTLLCPRASLSFWILPPVNRNLKIDKESTQNVFKGRFYSKLWSDRWVLIPTKDILHSDFCPMVTAVTKFKNI